MTNSEAIERLKYAHFHFRNEINEVEMKSIVGTDELEEFNIAISALEKQIPKKPITYQQTHRADCPVCKNTVRGIDKPFGDWCSHCGQKLDWSVKE